MRMARIGNLGGCNYGISGWGFEGKSKGIAIGISGIAGPGGSLPNKPVGLVHHALATKNNIKHRKIIHKGNRETIRKLSVKTALQMTLNEFN